MAQSDTINAALGVNPFSLQLLPISSLVNVFLGKLVAHFRSWPARSGRCSASHWATWDRGVEASTVVCKGGPEGSRSCKRAFVALEEEEEVDVAAGLAGAAVVVGSVGRPSLILHVTTTTTTTALDQDRQTDRDRVE